MCSLSGGVAAFPELDFRTGRVVKMKFEKLLVSVSAA
jgi:hypothetical protein